MKKHTFLLLSVLAGIMTIAGSCDKSPYKVVDGYIFLQDEGRRNDSTEWVLVWEDHFDKGSLDTSRWTRIGLFTVPQWKVPVEKWKTVTNCFRYITDTDSRVVEFDSTNILLKGIINPDSLTGPDPRPYLTGGIYTWEKFAFQYGRLEVRAKLDPAWGAWPAIWTMPQKKIYDHHNGEMDLMERLNHDDFAYQTTHNVFSKVLNVNNPPRSTKAKINPDDYNVYSVSWYPDKLVYGVNGVDTYTYPKVNGGGTFQWPFDQPFYIIIDQQMEHVWPGPISHPEELPISMTVDWVRLYQ